MNELKFAISTPNKLNINYIKMYYTLLIFNNLTI